MLKVKRIFISGIHKGKHYSLNVEPSMIAGFKYTCELTHPGGVKTWHTAATHINKGTLIDAIKKLEN